jgi:hypothetical protein
VLVAQAQVAVVHERQAGEAAHVGLVGRHHLGAAGDDHVLHAGHDRHGPEVRGGDARAAEPVERDAAGGDGEAGVERGHAPEVAALGADLGAGAEDDVVDVGGVQIVALGDGGQHRRPEALRVGRRQRSLPHLADPPRRAAAVDDPGVTHVFGPSFPSDVVRSSGLGPVCPARHRY